MRARSLTGTPTGVRRLRLSRIHVPLHPTHRSFGAVRENGPPRTDTSLEADAIRPTPSKRKRSQRVTSSIKRWGTTFPQTPPLGGTSPASLTTHHVTKTNSTLTHLTPFIRVRRFVHWRETLNYLVKHMEMTQP